jgi:hypothetical protein
MRLRFNPPKSNAVEVTVGERPGRQHLVDWPAVDVSAGELLHGDGPACSFGVAWAQLEAVDAGVVEDSDVFGPVVELAATVAGVGPDALGAW